MVKSESQTFGQYLAALAIHGGIAWTIYAIVECFFSSILTWINLPSIHFKPLHLGFTSLLFVIYPLFGLVILSIFGPLLRALFKKAQPSMFLPPVAAITIIFVFNLNLIRQFLNEPNLTILGSWLISFIMIFGLILRASSQKWFRKLAPVLNSWTISMVLVGLLWVHYELIGNSTIEKVAAFLIYPAFIFLISIFANRLFGSLKKNHSSPTPSWSLLYLAMGVLGLLSLAFILNQSPYQRTAPIDSIPMDKNHPNVLLITLDTVRRDHLSLYGYERDTTPNLRDFSNEATLFTKAISTSDITLSSHASIFTSLYASEHGAHYGSQYPNGHRLSDDFHTLAEVLSEKGYLTEGIVSNLGGIGYHYNMHQGFQFYDKRFPVSFLASTKFYYLRKGMRDLLTNFSAPSDYDKVFRNAEEINNEVFNQLEKLKKKEKAFFLFINYMDAHWPYIPPHPFDELYPGKNESINTSYYYKMLDEVVKLKRKVNNKERDHLLSQYDGAINYLDVQLGKLINTLKDMGLYDNTLIIIASDHGEVFGKRNLLGHGVSVYQDQVHIPLIVKYPNDTKKEVIDQLVSGIDIMPTIMDVLGYDVPQSLEGKSLRGLQDRKSRYIISESFADGKLADAHQRFQRIERAIFFENYKLIASTSGKRELYDLSQDPLELNNIYNVNNAMANDLTAKLENWLSTKQNEPVDLEKSKLDRVARERLKSLGYIK